ncbi:NADH-dependent flavin oxidoreductase [Cohnella candidum]|uniref:NADH-dependent flavin oxidoreductase n=1 Tax=Cohnella candidum TaxID=2674991 RepID=A0A3G3K250_9BACL|nr:NADH-dependent flavin oxidoreductase [Cohnella candidum]AYQ74625.1 NADH-dependent flavin oxidoreductase [Cohnella candidum]
MNPKFGPLFEEYVFPIGTHLKNRIVMAPMTNWSSHEDGTVSDAEVQYYARRSGGVSMVITACAYVTPSGKGFHGEFGAHRDEMVPSLRRLASAIKDRGAKAVLQIFHGGRSCPPELVPGGDVVSASAVPAVEQGSPVPRPLTHEEIEGIIRDFGEATRRAIEAGFDGVEIHGANGYLIQQFFSPHSNRRDDQWGGDLDGRMSFPLAVVEEVVRVATEYAERPFLVGYRFSPEEAESPGISMADTMRLLDALVEQPLDYLHVSLMDFWSAPRTESAESGTRMQWIQQRVGQKKPIIGVGAIRTPDDSLKALKTGVPLIALGRELIMEPDWVGKIGGGNDTDVMTTLNPADQERLFIPDPLWNAIMNTPGWFPVESKNKA